MRVLSALVLAAACGGAPPAPPVMPPARVVSLAPSITEIVYALGAADRLVGVCAQCNYPEAAAQLPRVGGYLVPHVELVSAAGGVNIAADVGGVWPQISLELVVARAPEVIVDAAMVSEAGRRDLFAGLATVPAVRDGRIVAFAGDAVFRAGPRVPEAARALAAAIHPEAFAAG